MPAKAEPKIDGPVVVSSMAAVELPNAEFVRGRASRREHVSVDVQRPMSGLRLHLLRQFVPPCSRWRQRASDTFHPSRARTYTHSLPSFPTHRLG